MHKALHPRDDVDWLYVSRKEGGRGLARQCWCTHTMTRGKHYGRRITIAKNDTDNTVTNRMTITRKQKWEEKQLRGIFKRLINNISREKTWTWLRKGNFKRETESLLIAAQNNAIRTNNIKARIDKTQQNSKCRLCGDRDKTTNHIISECSKLAQKEYKTRHDWGARWSTRWCARNLNLTIGTNGIYSIQQLSWRMTHINSYDTLTYKRIT